ncbi:MULTISPECIES: putative holin-like toxin [Bacillales]
MISFGLLIVALLSFPKKK